MITVYRFTKIASAITVSVSVFDNEQAHTLLVTMPRIVSLTETASADDAL